MKISYNWLKDFVNFDLDAPALAEALSLRGFEVENVITRRLDFDGVVIGKVLDCQKHPNADKLSLCTVDVGADEALHIVCGAPNVSVGQWVPVAQVGAKLPIGLKIQRARIRGEVSEGMICSLAELGLAEKSEGIWVLPEDLTVGAQLAQALEFETDYVLDIAVTPNRPDALSHIGIAREVAAIAGSRLDIREASPQETDRPAAKSVRIKIQSPEGCPRYSARVVRNVQIGPSPRWLRERLEAVGMRAINNIVDITNYVMLETGQPLHAFDYDRLAGHEIVVRLSGESEKFVTLDEKEHRLAAGTVLICDGEKPVALGGIMGGMNSEVSPQTVNILIESAYFDPSHIRRSVRHLGISSEAATRFERGTDPNGVIHAANRAAELMAELAGGQVERGIVDEYPQPISPAKIALERGQINKLLGTAMSHEEMFELLAKIGITSSGGSAVIPTFRPDVRQTADLAEEVGRLYGFDKIPVPESAPFPYSAGHNSFDAFLGEIRNALSGIGLQEVVTNSMVNSKEAAKLTGRPVYPIFNPISADMDGLRNSLIPSLLEVLRWNFNRQRKSAAVFEINTVFGHPGSTDLAPQESCVLCLAVTGLAGGGEQWYSERRSYDFYDLKGIIEHLAAKFSLDSFQFIDYDASELEAPALGIMVGETSVGCLGKISATVQSAFDIESSIFVAEIALRPLFERRKTTVVYQEIPRFPWVERDLAVVVDESVEAGRLLAVTKNHAGNFLIKTMIFDIYSGRQVAAGRKSVGLRLMFQSPERTLTETEVNGWMEAVLKALRKNFGAELRS